MTNRMSGMVLLATDATGDTWLTTPDGLRDDAADPSGRLRRGTFPERHVTVWEVTGSAVVGPLDVERVSWTQPETWTFSYPGGHTAFTFTVPKVREDDPWATPAT